VFGATYSSWCSAAPESFPLEAGRLLFNSNYNGTKLITQLMIPEKSNYTTHRFMFVKQKSQFTGKIRQ
jgi:hypothetical protein